MEHYPEELRTPPVMLVSLVGCPDLHPAVTSFLHSENPPMNTLALPEFSKISVLSGKKQKDGNDIGATSTGGILKRDWISKHRTKVPSVVAVFFAMDRVAGNPAQWQQVCTDLDNLKYASFFDFSIFFSSSLNGWLVSGIWIFVWNIIAWYCVV